MNQFKFISLLSETDLLADLINQEESRHYD